MSFKIDSNEKHKVSHTIVLWVLNLSISIMIAFIVYLTGGVTYSYTHLMYIPILFTAYSFGIWQTLVMAIFAGLIIGPFMPQEVESNLMQSLDTWLFRTFMFSLIGAVGSVLSIRFKRLQRREIDRLYINTLTNFPNFKKLKDDISALIEHEQEFYVLGFRVTNMNTVRQNTTYELGTKVLIKALNILKAHPNVSVYSIYSNEIGAIIKAPCLEDAVLIGNAFLLEASKPLVIEDCKISLLINGSIVHYPNNADNAGDIMKKISMILDQSTHDLGLHSFDEKMEEKSRMHSELVPDLLEALKDDEFTLVYQPKLKLNDNNNTYHVEALIRWHHPTKGTISPGLFIPIAEETGIITEITKLIIKKVINQSNIWRAMGLKIKTSINISFKDFNNQLFIDFLLQMIEDTQFDPTYIELEITERGVIKQSNVLIDLFNSLRQKGVKISIDDFGTGYNSLVNLAQIPMDFLKIDKSFIDHISTKKYQLLIKQLIKLAHQMDIQVVAEGVETKEQLETLKALDCDFIQGYYISKPLDPASTTQFYLKGYHAK